MRNELCIFAMLHVHTKLSANNSDFDEPQNEATKWFQNCNRDDYSNLMSHQQGVCALPVTTQFKRQKLTVTPGLHTPHPHLSLSDYNMASDTTRYWASLDSVKGLEEPEPEDNYDLGTVKTRAHQTRTKWSELTC